MKVVFLSLYSGVSARGVETHVHELANRLCHVVDVTVFQSGAKLPGAEYKTITIAAKIDWEKPDRRWKLSGLFLFDYWSRLNFSFTFRVLRLLGSDADILIPTNGLWQTVLCRLWSFLYRKKLVVAGHSGPGIDDRFNLLCRPDVFVTLTETQKTWAAGHNFGVRLEKISNGVDLKKFRPFGPRAEINLPHPLYLCVAGLEKNKRVDLTIQAVAKLPGAGLLVLGKGPEREKLNDLANRLMPGRYAFASVANNQMPRYYRTADVFTMASIPNESFGIVFLEAMASGLPVVAGNDPIRREIIGPAGFFVNPRNIGEYAKILAKAPATDWKNLPRSQAEKFSWEKTAASYFKLFSSLT